MERVSWLFVRESDSIRVDCRSDQLAITAYGPGPAERTFRFADQFTVAEFMKLYEQHLAADGWILQAFVERRADRASHAPPRDRRRRSDLT